MSDIKDIDKAAKKFNERTMPAQKHILDYTSSSKWSQIEKINWYTPEVMDMMTDFAEKENAKLKEGIKEYMNSISAVMRNANMYEIDGHHSIMIKARMTILESLLK